MADNQQPPRKQHLVPFLYDWISNRNVAKQPQTSRLAPKSEESCQKTKCIANSQKPAAGPYSNVRKVGKNLDATDHIGMLPAVQGSKTNANPQQPNAIGVHAGAPGASTHTSHIQPSQGNDLKAERAPNTGMGRVVALQANGCVGSGHLPPALRSAELAQANGAPEQLGRLEQGNVPPVHAMSLARAASNSCLFECETSDEPSAQPDHDSTTNDSTHKRRVLAKLKRRNSCARTPQDAVKQVSSVLAPTSYYDHQLHKHCAQASKGLRCEAGTIDVITMGRNLQTLGYSVVVRRALNCTQYKTPSLTSKFLVCQPQNSDIVEESIVDPNFKELFRVAFMTSGYKDLLDGIPEIFIGTSNHLRLVIQILCEEVELSFLEAGRPVPPWRSRAVVLNRWISDTYADIHLAMADFRGSCDSSPTNGESNACIVCKKPNRDVISMSSSSQGPTTTGVTNTMTSAFANIGTNATMASAFANGTTSTSTSAFSTITPAGDLNTSPVTSSGRSDTGDRCKSNGFGFVPGIDEGAGNGSYTFISEDAPLEVKEFAAFVAGINRQSCFPTGSDSTAGLPCDSVAPKPDSQLGTTSADGCVRKGGLYGSIIADQALGKQLQASSQSTSSQSAAKPKQKSLLSAKLALVASAEQTVR